MSNFNFRPAKELSVWFERALTWWYNGSTHVIFFVITVVAVDVAIEQQGEKPYAYVPALVICISYSFYPGRRIAEDWFSCFLTKLLRRVHSVDLFGGWGRKPSCACVHFTRHRLFQRRPNLTEKIESPLSLRPHIVETTDSSTVTQ